MVKKLVTILLTLLLALNSASFTMSIFADENEVSNNEQTEEVQTENEEKEEVNNENNVVEENQEVDQSEPLTLEPRQDDIRVRTGPGTNYDILRVNDEYQYYSKSETLVIIGQQTNDAGELWYNVEKVINNETYNVWIREDFAVVHKYQYDEEFEAMLSQEKFPDSYIVYLKYLHTLYPNWKFKADHTGSDFNSVIDEQSVLGKSLIDGNNLALRSTQEGAYNAKTEQYIPLDGNNWFQANRETISYFMDPRNFINDEDIFQFLKLSFNENENEEMIQKVLDGTFMSGNVKVGENEEDIKSYSQIFFEAGKEANTSPIYLATLAKQEQGASGSAATDGRTFTYDGVEYSSIYNFYNIHAYSGSENWKYGLVYAAKEGSYNRPWNTVEKAIKGGALWIADGYITDGQDTLYYQKYNVVEKDYSHQYMTNVRAAYSESYTIYKAYKLTESLNSELTFSIPVFENMPEKTELPTSVSKPVVEPETPNEEFFSGDFILDLDLLNDEGYLSGFTYQETYGSLKEKLKLMNKNINVVITLNDEEISDETLLASKQVVKIIDEDGESFYTIIIRGDINGDGEISTVDYLMYRRTLLGEYQMSEIEKKAAYINGETDITTLGYLHLRRYLLGTNEINQ